MIFFPRRGTLILDRMETLIKIMDFKLKPQFKMWPYLFLSNLESTSNHYDCDTSRVHAMLELAHGDPINVRV